MKVYGYARISRRSQSIDRQIRNIRAAYPTAVILQEAFTGTKVEGRKEFEKLLKAVKAGDCIVFDSVFRSPVAGGGAWEPNKLYRWSWILAKKGNGAWIVINKGYA